FSIFFFSSRRRHTRWPRDWSSDVCSSDLLILAQDAGAILLIRIDITGFRAQAEYAKRRAQQFTSHAEIEAVTSTFEMLSKAPCKIGRASCRERVEISGVAV